MGPLESRRYSLLFGLVNGRAGWLLAAWLALPIVAPAAARQPTTGPDTSAARALLGQARAHYRAGRIDQALAAYRALAEATEAEDPATAALAFHNRCFLLNQRGDYRAALPDCERALELRRPLADEPRLARTLNNLGLVLEHLGRSDEARRRFEEALAINLRVGDSEAVALNHSNLATLATASGDYERALGHLTQAEAVSRQAGDQPWAAEQLRIARLNRGVVFEKLGAYREALRIYLDMAAEGERMDPPHRAALRVNMGVLYRNLGDPLTAVESFEKAGAIFEQLGDEASLSNALLNLALARHHNLDDPEGAEKAYRRALELARHCGDRSEEVQDLFYLGELLAERGRLPEARRMFEHGLEVAEANGSAEGLWSSLQGLGETALAAGEPQEALGFLLRAIDEIERVRASIQQPSRRAGYFGDKRRAYADAVVALGELERREPGRGHAERALEVVQRAKARELLEAMGAQPGLAPLGARVLQNRAGETPVMELFIARDRLYAWIFSRERLRMRDLGPAAPLLTSVDEIHRDLSAGREPSSSDVRELSSALVEASGLLEGDPHHVRIAPDGGLFYLPFEILEDPATGASLVERVAISYLPCASLLPKSERDRSLSAPRLLGFGNPEMATTDGAASSTAAGLLTARFHPEPLPSAEKELAAIARGWPGEARILTGADATEETFRREVGRGARVVHLATHTLIDERLTGASGGGAAVLLTPADGDNGMLTPTKIAALDVRVDLTVLASCRSALGPLGDGQGLASLTGALLAAGSSAVIATLWDVEDAAATVFMSQLYHELERGLPPAEALRATKRRLRTHPVWGRTHLWAGYVLIGDAPPVTQGRWLQVWGWALLAGVGATLAAALWSRRRV